MNDRYKNDNEVEDFLAESTARRSGIIVEFLQFLSYNKKWWLLPVLIMFLLFGLLLTLGSSAVAPFIYPIF